MPPDLLARPKAAEALAFQMQESNFVERIVRPQFGGEFQAIDDGHGLPQPDVFGAQVSMRINISPRVDPLEQQG